MSANQIADLSGVSPQRTYLQSTPERPSPSSTLYIRRFTTTNADRTQDHTIVGVHVVLKKNDANKLWESFHVDRAQQLNPLDPRVTTRALLICCDTLEIHGELSVPEANVSIFARKLVFSTADAAINTSPLGWSVNKAANAADGKGGANGAAGRKAGDIRVFASVVDPADDGRPRFVAMGGRGQEPGAGKDGTRGNSMRSFSSVPFELNDSDISTSRATVNFSPAAVYIDYEWRWAASHVTGGKKGDDSFPTDGTDALAPGAPGQGGNGGAFTTNSAGLAKGLRNAGGAAGAKERDYFGGPAGTPTQSAKYKVKMWHDLFGTNNAKTELNKYAEKTTKNGNNAAAPAAKSAGTTPAPSIVNASNAWLHPLSLQATLEYARELFLSGAREDVQSLLLSYDSALTGTTPDNGAWDDGNAALWTSAHAEVAAMLQRLRGHLDYYGNRAGYTPLLSLQSSIEMYSAETRRSLRTLLLVRWIDAKERSAKESEAALADLIKELNADTQQAAEQVTRAEAKISDATKRIEGLEQELGGMSNQLANLRNDLLSKAQNDLDQQAQIKFAIRMAAAVCQVIPVGQPALGTIGSLAGLASNFVGDDGSKAPDTVSKMGDVLKKANEASKKAKEAKEKADKEKAAAPEKDAEGAKKKSSAWAQVGKGLGPAMAQVSEGIKALQVPASEVEAELERLQSESPEWNKMVEKIRDLNERKTALFEDLAAGFESLGDGYARISSNAAGVFTMFQERSSQLGKLDPAATSYVRQMGQRSRLTLQKYLYLMVKSYETTVFKPISVDWNLTDVTDKIIELMKPDSGFSSGSVIKYASELEPLYQQNIDRVRHALETDFSFGETTITLQLGLSKAQTPDILATLNAAGEVSLDPVAYGLLLPDQQLARISSIVLKSLEFDPSGPALAETHNMLITVRPSHSGTMRKAEQLYAVYSDEPMKWSWTRLASGEVRPGKPSHGAEDMLNLLLGPGAEKIKQKVALPPLWSDLMVKVTFSPEMPPSQQPRISRLYFELGCDINAAPAQQRVVNVQSRGVSGGAVVQCSPDLAKRAAGFESMVRIFSKSATVQLSVPEHVGGAAFASWDLIGRSIERRGITKNTVEFTADDHVLAYCNWTRAHTDDEPIVLSRDLAPEDVARIAELHADAHVRDAFALARDARPQPVDLLIHSAANGDSPVIGSAPSLDAVETVETGTDGWLLINYRGIVGWTQTLLLELPVVPGGGDLIVRPEQ